MVGYHNFPARHNFDVLKMALTKLEREGEIYISLCRRPDLVTVSSHRSSDRGGPVRGDAAMLNEFKSLYLIALITAPVPCKGILIGRIQKS